MNHPDRKKARAFDSPYRDARVTDAVYGGDHLPKEEYRAQMGYASNVLRPEPNRYNLYFGDLHGHTNLSDGSVDPDTFFRNLRDLAKVDFCALSDHDHGGVGKPELWGADPVTGMRKWDVCRQKTDEYYEPGKFTTIPAYERDSYPWFTNMVLYFRSMENAELVRGVRDGEITEAELEALYAREDVIYGPHTCTQLDPGCYLVGRRAELMPKTFEIYSRGGAYEYYDNPFPASSGMRGGSYIDALENGAHPACIACTDDHRGFNGRDLPDDHYAGMTGVWAEENTREAIFDALKARRCYAFMGEKRVTIDFRINGHYMGEIINDDADQRTIFYSIESEVPVERVDLIKNGRSELFFRKSASQLMLDYRADRDEDYYYLRILLQDGRYAWTSPIWVRK